jgi:enoyl-[acyl-carrier-protein] reductase (NADH)
MQNALIDLRGKRGLILGIANERSIACGAARLVTGSIGFVDAGYHVMG